MASSAVYSYTYPPSDLGHEWREFHRNRLILSSASNPRVTFWGDKIFDGIKITNEPYVLVHAKEQMTYNLDAIAKKFVEDSENIYAGKTPSINLKDRVWALDLLGKLNTLYAEADKNINIITKIIMSIRSLFSCCQAEFSSPSAHSNFRAFTLDEYKKEFDPYWPRNTPPYLDYLMGAFQKDRTLNDLKGLDCMHSNEPIMSPRFKYIVKEDFLREHAKKA